jgi:hypothetical protein
MRGKRSNKISSKFSCAERLMYSGKNEYMAKVNDMIPIGKGMESCRCNTRESNKIDNIEIRIILMDDL